MINEQEQLRILKHFTLQEVLTQLHQSLQKTVSSNETTPLMQLNAKPFNLPYSTADPQFTALLQSDANPTQLTITAAVQQQINSQLQQKLDKQSSVMQAQHKFIQSLQKAQDVLKAKIQLLDKDNLCEPLSNFSAASNQLNPDQTELAIESEKENLCQNFTPTAIDDQAKKESLENQTLCSNETRGNFTSLVESQFPRQEFEQYSSQNENLPDFRLQNLDNCFRQNDFFTSNRDQFQRNESDKRLSQKRSEGRGTRRSPPEPQFTIPFQVQEAPMFHQEMRHSARGRGENRSNYQQDQETIATQPSRGRGRGQTFERKCGNKWPHDKFYQAQDDSKTFLSNKSSYQRDHQNSGKQFLYKNRKTDQPASRGSGRGQRGTFQNSDHCDRDKEPLEFTQYDEGEFIITQKERFADRHFFHDSFSQDPDAHVVPSQLPQNLQVAPENVAEQEEVKHQSDNEHQSEINCYSGLRNQIDIAMRSYDEKSLFEKIEEARMLGSAYPWQDELAETEKFLDEITMFGQERDRLESVEFE